MDRIQNTSSEDLAAGWEELQRGVAALAKNSARPHKQLVQRGTFSYNTGNVLQFDVAPVRFSSILEEVEHAVGLRTQVPVPSWQDKEPKLERNQLEITVKVFVRPTSTSLEQDIKQVVATACSSQQTTFVDTLVIAAPEAGDFDGLFDAWAVAETLHSMGVVRRLGVSNVDASRLQTLFSTARVKPAVVQVRPSSASQITPLATAEGAAVFVDTDADISLHNAEKRFGNHFHNALVPPFSQTSFSPLAIARFTVFVPERAILTAKGYVAKTKYNIA